MRLTSLTRIIVLFLMLAGFSWTAALAQEGEPPEALLNEDDEGSTPPAAALSPNLDNFNFDPSALRDPFRPYQVFRPAPVVPSTTVPKKKEYDPSSLLGLDLRTVEVVAIVWDVKSPRALIRAPGGSFHTLRRNAKIGRNEGVVVAIREGEVVVLETFYEEGKTYKEYSSLRMKAPDLSEGARQ